MRDLEVSLLRKAAFPIVLIVIFAQSATAADLVRIVRMKLSAGDLSSGISAVEDYRRDTGVDAEYLNAVGWLARGSLMLGRPDLARTWIDELRREITSETPENMIALGAAIEVEGRLLARTDGTGAAVRFYESELERTTTPALRSRIYKNINLLTLEGNEAPQIQAFDGQRGKRPTVLFFWAHWCGDCSAQSATFARIRERYRGRGVDFLAVTRHYGTGAEDEDVEPDEETSHIHSVWKEKYPGLGDVPVVIDSDAMIRYGVSATPTWVLLDSEGVVQLYTPTRLSEAELARRIDSLLQPENRSSGAAARERLR